MKVPNLFVVEEEAKLFQTGWEDLKRASVWTYFYNLSMAYKIETYKCCN